MVLTLYIAESAFKKIGALICFFLLGKLDKLQKRVCGTGGPSFAISLESLAPCWNVTRNVVFSVGVSLVDVCSNSLHGFSVAIPGCYKNTYVDSSFPRNSSKFLQSLLFSQFSRLWNYLLAECFPLTYDLVDILSLELIGTFWIWVF